MQHFGKKDVEPDPKVWDKKADFRIRSIDTYIEVHAIKNIAIDQLKITEKGKNTKLFELKDNGKQEGQHKILDRIANKLLHECTQLPDGKKNLIVTKTEGFFISPDDVIDAVIGKPQLLVDPNTMQSIVGHGESAFRTMEELQQALEKISAIIAYDTICPHGKLHGIIGNNKNNAKMALDEDTYSTFQRFLCEKCA